MRHKATDRTWATVLSNEKKPSFLVCRWSVMLRKPRSSVAFVTTTCWNEHEYMTSLGCHGDFMDIWPSVFSGGCSLGVDRTSHSMLIIWGQRKLKCATFQTAYCFFWNINYKLFRFQFDREFNFLHRRNWLMNQHWNRESSTYIFFIIHVFWHICMLSLN